MEKVTVIREEISEVNQVDNLLVGFCLLKCNVAKRIKL
jgi:hypothetical protein